MKNSVRSGTSINEIGPRSVSATHRSDPRLLVLLGTMRAQAAKAFAAAEPYKRMRASALSVRMTLAIAVVQCYAGLSKDTLMQFPQRRAPSKMEFVLQATAPHLSQS